jgi:hypothetical protein
VLFFAVAAALLLRKYIENNDRYTQLMQQLFAQPHMRGQEFFISPTGYMGLAVNVSAGQLALVAHGQPIMLLSPEDVSHYEILTDMAFVAGHVYAHNNHLHQTPSYHIASHVTLRLHLVGQHWAEFSVVFYERWRYVEVKRRYRHAVLHATTWGYRLDRFLGR